MRFACPYCQTKYQIPAEKLTSGVVRVQCKICTKIIAVRNPKSAGAAGENSASKQSPPSVDPNHHWHFVLGEEKTGPHPIEVLISAIASGEVTAETYAWRPGMEAWEQAKDIEELSAKFSQPAAPEPPSRVPGTGASRAERTKRSGGQAPRAPVGQGRRGGRFTRVGAKTRTPGASPTGAPRSRVVGPTRRFPAPGVPGAASRPATAAEAEADKPYLKTPQQEDTPEGAVAPQPVVRDEPMVPQEISSPPAVKEEQREPAASTQEDQASQEPTPETPIVEENEELLSFDATLPDGGALDNLAGELAHEPQEEKELEEFEATLEDNQLSHLAGTLDEEEEPFVPQIPESTERTEESGLTDDSSHESPEEETEQEDAVEETPVEETPEEETPEETPVEETPEETPVEETPEEETPEEETPEEETPEEETPEEETPEEETPEEETPEEETPEEETPEEETPEEETPEEETPEEETPEEETPEEETPEEEPEEEEPEEETPEEEEPEEEEAEEEGLVLEQDTSENELELDDPSNPQTAGPTLPFHLDEQQRTSLDELFSPLDSKPVPPDSIIQPFSQASRDQKPSSNEEVSIERPKSSSEETHEADSPDLDDELTIMENTPDELESSSQSLSSLQAVVLLDEDDDENNEDDFLQTDFFSVEDEAADEDSLSFELAPPALPSKEEIRESKNELKKLLSEAADEQKQGKSISSKEIKRAKEEVKQLGMDAPSSRPSGKRLSVVAATLIGVVVMIVIFSSQDNDEPTAPPPPVSVQSTKVFENGQIKRPSYEEPLQVEKTEEEASSRADEEDAPEEDSSIPAWKANFEEESNEATKKKSPSPSKGTVKETVKEEVKQEEGKPLDNRALAGLMGKDDGANLKGLKDDTKKALSGMKTATEVSSDVLNKLFLKRSPQIKRCANRHNLTGKVVVKFAVALSGETSNTQVIATPTPPTSDGIECIEKIVNSWKFPPQDQETIFSKILVF